MSWRWSWRSVAKWSFVLGTIALFILLFRPHESFPQLLRLNPGWLAAGLCLSATSLWVLRPLIWKVFFLRDHQDISLSEIFRVLSVSAFYTLLVPARTGEPITAYLFQQKIGCGYVRLLGFALVERLFMLLATLGLLLLALVNPPSVLAVRLLGMADTLARQIWPWPIVILLGLVVGGVVLFRLRYRQELTEITDLIKRLLNTHSLMSNVLLLSLSYIGLGILSNVTIILGYPQSILLPEFSTITIMVVVTCSSVLAGLFSPFPFGIGFGEFGFAALLVVTGFSPQDASTVVLINLLMYYILTLVGYLAARPWSLRQSPTRPWPPQSSSTEKP